MNSDRFYFRRFFRKPAPKAPVRRRLLETLEDRVLYDAAPVVTVDTAQTAMISEEFEFAVSFRNAGDADGYGPFVDIRIGQGIDLVGNPTYVGQSVQLAGPTASSTPPDASNPTALGIGAGYDNSGGLVDVTFVHLYTGEAITVAAGEEYYVYELPFGSFVPGQPVVDLLFTAVTDKAEGALALEPGQTLPIEVRGGFRFGQDPLDNRAVDPQLLSATVTGHITPTVWEVSKWLSTPEGETATGENFPRTWGIHIDVADGETVTGVNVQDVLPGNLQYLPGSITVYNVTGGTWTPLDEGADYTVVGEPDGSTPGGRLELAFASITGGQGNDVVIRYQAYVPEFDADGNRVIDPDTGLAVASTNGVDASAWYDPDGAGTAYVPFQIFDNMAAPGALQNSATLTDRSLAIQKNVSGPHVVHEINNPLDWLDDQYVYHFLPGDALTYSLDFQLSDYFSFENLVITDTLGDGQLFDPAGPVTLVWSQGGVTTTTAFDLTEISSASDTAAAAVTVTQYGAGGNAHLVTYYNSSTTGALTTADGTVVGAGQTVIKFYLSAEMGVAILAGGATTGTNVGPTTGRITYRANVQEDYVGPVPGDASIDIGDTIGNQVEISGNVSGSGSVVTDDSGMSLVVPAPTLTKTVFAVNGDPAAATTPAVAPGDTLTYRLTLTLPTADIEDLQITDFIPMPLFNAGDLTAPAFTVVSQTAWGAGYVPAAGAVVVVLADDVYAATGNGSQVTFSVSSAANSFTIDLGSFDVDGSSGTVIAVYFTVMATGIPMGDGLLLTNQMVAQYNNTGSTQAVASSIVQVEARQPVVDIYKGVVATDAGAGSSANAGGVAFGGVGSPGFTGTLDSKEDAQAVGELDLTDELGTLPDAGDRVRFALIVQNTGRADAFDVVFSDTIPESYGNDFADAAAFAAATNFQVYDGAGNLLAAGTDYLLTWNSLTHTFTVTLVNTGGAGALAAGKDAGGTEVATGLNAVVVLYDLTLVGDVQASSTVTNQAVLSNYAGIEGGVDHTAVDKKERASVRIAAPELEKVLVGTSVNETGNGANQAVIGELAEYTITLTIGEGTTTGVIIQDLLDSGLAFVEFTGLTLSAGVATGLDLGGGATGFALTDLAALNAAINDASTWIAVDPATGQLLTLNLGTIANTGLNNGAVETITITYTAVVLNVAGNQQGTTLGNTATLTYGWTDDRPQADPVIAAATTTGDLGGVFSTTATGTLAGIALTGGALVIDGVSLSVNDLVLVKDQANPAQNGIYRVSLIDVAGGTATLVRHVDFNEASELAGGSSVPVALVAGGNTWAGETFSLWSAVTTLNVDPIQFGYVTVPGETDTLAPASAAPVTVVEPQVAISNTLSTDGVTWVDSTPAGSYLSVSAGQTVYYRLDITNTGPVAAYDLSVYDRMPNVFVIAETTVVSVVRTLADGVTTVTLPASDFGITTDTFFGPELPALYTAALLDLAAGEKLTIIVRTTVKDDAVAASTHPNGVAVRWTSLNDDVRSNDGSSLGGASPVGGVSIPVVLSAYNTAAVERTGSDGIGGALNDYASEDPIITIMQVEALSLAKLLVGTQIDTGVNSATQAVIGEYVDYSVSFSIPKGSTAGFTLTDILQPGLAFSEFLSVTVGENVITNLDATGTATATSLSFGDPANLASLLANTVVSSNGTQLLITLGNIFNSEPAAAPGEYVAPQQITITYRAIVTNVAGNQSGATLANTATIRYNSTNDGSPLPESVTASSTSESVTLIEPALQVVKTVNTSSSRDAGDAVTQTIVIRHTGASQTDAFDLTFSDPLSPYLVPGTTFTVTHSTLGDISAQFELVGGVLRTTASADVDLALGAEITITVSSTIAADAPAGMSLASTATVQWTSIDGSPSATSSYTTDDTERTGAGGINDYSTTGTVALSVALPALDLQWRDGSAGSAGATSVGSSSGSNLVIGEQAVFDVLVTLPEGETQDLRVLLNLPAGLRLDSYEILTAAGSSGLLTAGFAGTVTGSPSVSTSGAVTTFDFDNVTTTADGDVANNRFVIRVTATVLNELANQAGVTLAPTATLRFNDPDGTSNDGTPTPDRSIDDSDSANNPSLVVVEPTLTISKTVDAASPDAGDTITYTITISNTSGQTAYDLTLSDLLPSSLTNVALQSVTGGGFSIPDFQVVGNQLSTTGGNVDLASGASVTITVTAKVVATVQPGQLISNTANVRWTSTDGANADERGGGDVADPAPTTINQALTTGPLNNYALSSSVVTSTVGNVVIAKTVADTSLGGLDGVVAPGEIVTYRITVTLPEGVAPELRIRDSLPAGMAYIPGTVQLETGAFNGLVTSPAVTPATGSVYADGTDVIFDFGSITVADDNVTGNNTFSFTFQAVVLDVAGNVGAPSPQTVLGNTADHNNGSGVTYGGATPVVNLTVVEPRIANLVHSVAVSSLDAGDTASYSITFSNTGTSTAYDVRVTDALPSYLALNLGSVSLLSSGGVSGITNSSSGNNLDLRISQIPVGGSVTITYTAALQSTVTPNQAISSTANLTYSSQPGDLTAAGGYDPSADVTTDRERVVTASDSASITVPPATISKVLHATSDGATTGSNVAIGESVTYALIVTLPEGTTPGLTVVDLLPAGLQYQSFSLVTTAADSGGLLAADFNGTLGAPTVSGGAANGDDVTFTFGSIAVAGDNAANNNTFVILVTALVLDVGGNVAGTSLSNAASLDVPGDDLAPVTTPSVSVSVVEPRVTVTKSADDTDRSVSPGETYTYTIVLANTGGATAFEVALADAIPAGLALVPGSIDYATTGTVTDVTNTSAGTGIAFTAGTMSAGAMLTVTYKVTVAATATGGTVIENNARVTFSSQSGSPAGERSYAPVTPDEVYNADTDPFQDTERVTIGTGAIGDRVWFDRNGDGVQDAGEHGIAGVTVQLTGANPDGSTYTRLAVTDSTGAYLFSGLAAGDYTISIIATTLPDGAASVATYDLDGTGTAHSASVTLTAGQTRADADFGYRGTGVISDRVWLDLDGDGVQDANEPGIGGVTLDLIYDIDNDGVYTAGTDVVIATTTTGVTGQYAFDGLISNRYLVRVTDTGGVLADAVNTFNVDDAHAAANATDGISAVAVAVGQLRTDVDFGYRGASSLGGGVWNDMDGDGVADATEPGLASVPVQLEQLINGSYVAIATATTDAAGAYTFTGLIAGSYRVTVTTPPASSTATYDLDGTATPSVALRSVGSDEQAADVDFGYQGAASIGDLVYFDIDGDGVRDATEPGLAGVTVFLDFNNDGLLDANEARVTTAANGTYSFTGLVAGTYHVRVLASSLPAGSVNTDTFDQNGGTPVPSGAANPLHTEVLAAAETQAGVDFGFNGSRVISGASYRDADKNGALDAGETGIGGVTIELIWDTNNDGLIDAGDFVLATTLTAADGSYSFGSLIAGNYLVREIQPDGFGNGENGTNIIDVTLAAANLTGRNFGNTTGSLSGTVFHDADNNGALGGSETGIAGVTVTLEQWNGAAYVAVATTVTDADGNYTFDHTNTAGAIGGFGDTTSGLLATGIYRITQTTLAGYLDGADSAGNAGVAAGTVEGTHQGRNADAISGIRITAGQDAGGYRFGDVRPSSFSGASFVDLDGDGVFDSWESGLAGVTITLTGVNDLGQTVSLSTTTGADGAFTFTGLRPSDAAGYVITQTQPAGYTTTTNTAGDPGSTVSGDAITTVQINSGVAGTGNLFGEAFDFALAKSIFATSHAGTTGANVVVGEVVTYQLVVNVPYGSLADFQFQDHLPPGLRFLNDGTATVAYTTGLSGGVAAGLLPDAAVSASPTANDDAYVSGTDVYFKLGTVNNTATTPQTITITFKAVVVDEPAVTGGSTLGNDFSVRFDTTGDGVSDASTLVSNTVEVDVLQPALQLVKTFDTATGDAGDVITMTLVVTNNGTASGYDTVITDTLNGSQFDLDSFAALSTPAGWTLGYDPATGTITYTHTDAAGLAVGGTATFTFTATVADAVRPGTVVSNTASAVTTTLPGTVTGERTEAAVSDTDTLTVPSTLALAKTLESTDNLQTTGGNVAVGETATFRLTVTLQEGTTATVTLHDSLPPGVVYQGGSAVFRALTAGSTAVGAVSGTVYTDGATIAADDLVYNAATGQLTVSLTTVLINPGATTGSGQFAIDYSAKVSNVAANVSGVTLTNSAYVTADRNGDGDTVDVGETSPTSSQTLTVVEPELAIETTILTPTDNVDAGDTVTYQIVVSHTAGSTSGAFDLSLTDSLPGALEDYVITGATIGATDVSGAFSISGTSFTTTGDIDLALGQTLTITITAKAKDSNVPGTVISNEATVAYSSQDGTVAGERAYSESDAAPDIVTVGFLSAVKTADKGTAAIGEVVTYTVTVTVAEGTTTVRLDDTLPAGMALVANSAALTTPAGWTILGFDTNNVDQTLTVTHPGAVDRADTLDTGSFTFTYRAVVQNVLGNQDAVVLANDLDVSADLNNDGDTADAGETVATSVDVTVVEPHITATKTVSDATPHLGDTITYTLVLTNDGTSDAFGVVLAELLPAGVTLTSLTSTTPAGGATVLTATSITGGGAGLAGVYDIPVGATVTIVYEAQVSADPAIVGGLFGGADDTLTGTVSVTWTSLDGTVTGERTGTDGEGPDATVLNNYANTTQWSVTVVGADLALVKDDALASVSPGDTWTYTLTVSNNGTDTATGVVLTESIPAEIALGTVLVNGVAVTVTPVAGGFTVALPDIAAGAAVTVEVEVTLAAAVSVGYEQFTNTASVTHDDVEPTVTDNTDDDTNLIDAAPAIGVVKEVTAVNGGAVPLNSLGQPVIAPGDTLIYRIVVTNTGDQHALVNILDTFPGVTLDLSTVTIDDAATGVTAVIDLASGTIAWNGVSLDAGQTIVITIEAEALDPQLQAIDNFTNTVVVTNLNPNNPAEDGVEARDDALVDLDAFPDLVVTKVNSTDRIGLDDTFTYTITLSNRGDQNATGVTVVDTLPPHVEFLGASGNYTWDPVARTITWTSADNPGLQTVEGRGAETLTFTVTVKLPINSIVFGDLTNTVRAFDDGANGPDINPPDNEASVTTGVLGFLYDSFQNYSLFERGGDDDWHRLGLPIEIYHDAILPIAPIYSGAAEPGSTLEVVLYNANGDVIGRQTVMVDTGGGWMASFPGAIVKDYPQSVVITQTPPANQAGGGHGYNLRPYYATAINAGHFFKENLNVTRLSEQTAESSGSALAEANGNPVGFDPGSGVYETLALPGHPTGR